MRKADRETTGTEPRSRSTHVLAPLVALFAHHDDRAAANFEDLFEDIACDWRLVRVTDGKAAARHVMNKGLPDLLVTSPDLPEVSGSEFVEWMRSFRRGNAVPVFVYGEPSDNDSREQFLRNDVKLIVPDNCPRQTLAGHLAKLVALAEKSRFSTLN